VTDYPRAPKQAIDGHLYADAGLLAAQVEERGVLVWRINPSPIGFTWAWVRTDRDDVEVARDSGYYLCPIAIEGGVYAASSDPDELARGQRTTIHAADYSRPSRRVSVPVSPFNVLTDELASAQKPAALEAWHAKEADQDPPTIAATTPTPTDR
jgi:hypothetical protein